MKNIGLIILLMLLLTLIGCTSKTLVSEQNDVQGFFKTHKIGSSPDYAVMKNGTDHLMTIHGYMDDQSVCLSLIEQYNKDPSLSTMPGTYTCVPLNI